MLLVQNNMILHSGLLCMHVHALNNAVLAPSCQQIMNELLKDSVACSYDRLGIQLGLSPDTIECITMNHRDVYRCLIDVINHWVNTYQVSWSAVASALDQIDRRKMAETIRIKYNMVTTGV